MRPLGEPVVHLAAWPGPSTGQPVKWAEIDSGALRRNAAALVAHVGPDVRVMAMIKANGYGHGALLAARAFMAGGAAWLGVSSPEEALQVRRAGIDAPLLIVGWSHPSHHQELIRAGVDMTVFDVDTIRATDDAARALGTAARVQVKVDTGMNRLGVPAAGLVGIAEELSRRSHLDVTGIFTHFADADGDDLSFTHQQHDRFLRTIAPLRARWPEALVHCSNSAATLRLPGTWHDLVRPGLALYGYPPVATSLKLEPALTMAACITQVKWIDAGDAVGYGCTWSAPRRSRIATVGAGYADGIQRLQAQGGVVLVDGQRCPIVGRVSMDQITVDVTDVSSVRQGDEAVIIGGGRGGRWLGADDVAATAGTVAYEVLCAVSARVPRVAATRSAPVIAENDS